MIKPCFVLILVPVKFKKMKKQKLKICHVITRMIIGGAQENTLLSVIGQIEQGHDVTLVTGPSPGPEGELLKQSKLISKYDLKVIKVPHLVRTIDPVRDFMAYSHLKKFFQTNKFDVVHTHSSKAGIVGRAAACSAKVTFIAHTIHGQAFHRYANPLKKLVLQKTGMVGGKTVSCNLCCGSGND